MLPPYHSKNLTEKGFTLMEILVAVMVLAITMTVIMQLFSGGLRAERVSEEYTGALFCGRTAMEELLLAEELAEGVLDGECEDGTAWRAEIRSLLDDEEEEVMGVALVPFRVDLDVNWKPGQGGKHFRLSTIHLAETAEQENEL